MKLLLTGDYFFDYEDCQNDFDRIKDRLEKYDYSIVNYEGSFKSETVKRKSVNLSMSVESLNYKNKNVIFCLANNHVFDYDKKGLFKTVELMRSLGFSSFGLESKTNQFDNFIIIEKDNIKVCIAAFGWLNEECVPSTSHMTGNVNLTKGNVERLFQSLEEVEYDELIIYSHYGYEYEYYPLPLHLGLFRYMIDLGASLVYSSHSHIVQPYEIYKGKYIFYGLGNFYFGSRRNLYPESSDRGLVLEVEISNEMIVVHPKYVKYDRKALSSFFESKCNYFNDNLLKESSLDNYSDNYKLFRSRKKNPRPILYWESAIGNILKYKAWKLAVDITGFLKIRQFVKKILGWG